MNCIKECHSNNMICSIHNMSCVGIVMTCGARSFVEPTCTKVYSLFLCKPNFSFHLQWTLLEEKENEMKIKNDIGDSKDVYHWKICHMLVTLTPSLIQVIRIYFKCLARKTLCFFFLHVYQKKDKIFICFYHHCTRTCIIAYFIILV
jgi:hypothetical protein